MKTQLKIGLGLLGLMIGFLWLSRAFTPQESIENTNDCLKHLESATVVLVDHDIELSQLHTIQYLLCKERETK